MRSRSPSPSFSSLKWKHPHVQAGHPVPCVLSRRKREQSVPSGSPPSSPDQHPFLQENLTPAGVQGPAPSL